MDFVDLDKVLDDFEEEEKAASSLLPGQESKPSGYAQYIEANQERPWEVLSRVPVTNIPPPTQNVSSSEPSNSINCFYDVPYDHFTSQLAWAERERALVSGQKHGITGILANNVHNNSNPAVYHGGLPELIQGYQKGDQDDKILKGGDSRYNKNEGSYPAEKFIRDGVSHNLGSDEMIKNSFQNFDGKHESVDGNVPDSIVVSNHISSGKSSVQASQVTAVQTDALTPCSERELMSQPLPKSDIIVDPRGPATDRQDSSLVFQNSSSNTVISTQHSYNQNSYTYASQGSQIQGDSKMQSDNQTVLMAGKKEDSDMKQNDINSLNSVDTSHNCNFEFKNEFSNINTAAMAAKPQAEEEKNAFSIPSVADGETHNRIVGFGDTGGELSEKDIEDYLKAVGDVAGSSTRVSSQSVVESGRDKMDQLNHAHPGMEPSNSFQNPDIVADVKQHVPMRLGGSTVQYSDAELQHNHVDSLPNRERENDNLHMPCPEDVASDGCPGQNVMLNSQDNSVDVMHTSDNSLPRKPSDVNETGQTARMDLNKASSQTSAPKSQVLFSGTFSVDSQSTASMDSILSDGPREAQTSSSSPAPSSSSPSDQGSPQQMTGIGARPKDPAAMKKNRPNSLLGLSKVSLDTPFTSSQPFSVDSHENVTASHHSFLEAAAVTVTGSDDPGNVGDQLNSPRMLQQRKNLPIDGALQMEVEQRLRMDGESQANFCGSLHEAQISEPGFQQQHQDSDAGEFPQQTQISAYTASTCEEETPVLRRKLDDHPPDGVPSESQAMEVGRPHSWSPPGGPSLPAQKQKRPNSLNLPTRKDLGPHGEESPDSTCNRTRGVGLLPQTQISEESEAAAAEESVGEETSGELGEMSEGTAAAASDGSPSQDSPLPPIIHNQLGKVAPHWIPDADAPNCMQCQARFTFTKRRHHCRACGKVFCSACCGQKGRLVYMDNKEARVCQSCHQVLQMGSQRRSEPKQVMFSDGIRPGGDLTELDGSNEGRLPPRRSGRVQKKVEKAQAGQSSPKTRRLRGSESKRYQCLIPTQGLPPLFIASDIPGDYHLEENPDPAKFMPQIRNKDADPVAFAINNNLFVMVKINYLDCCLNRECWCFTTKGMCTVGQDEIVLVLETIPDEEGIPLDIFYHLSTVYEEASKGNTVSDMGHSIFNQSFLDSRDHGGFLYIRPTFQCLQKILLPSPPYVFGILLQKWETPWAKVFPIRLLLRLGAEYRYYPCPLVSIRNRKPVFFEIGHTIMNLLADFRNYQYMLPQIKGVHIHMEDKHTMINFPRNRYDDLMKVVNNSNEHVMALGANFSAEADSHLVCIQNDEGNYQTQAINIQNKPRKVTGASFVVFNGALKVSSGLRAKSSIVEDGLMVQITPEAMAALKQAMKDMREFAIGCGSLNSTQPEEVVLVQWVDDDKNVNVGVKSPIDKMAMDGIESIHIHNSTDYVGENKVIRWTEVFFIQNEDTGSSKWEPVDLSRLAETLASACCIALTSHLEQLREASLTQIGLRVTLEAERVGYEIGANGDKLPDFYMNNLDSALIPVIHNAASQNQDGRIVIELVFHILD